MSTKKKKKKNAILSSFYLFKDYIMRILKIVSVEDFERLL